jgi:hypothetical protein
MEKLFAINNIKLQQINKEDEQLYFAYTDSSLKKNVIIEFSGVSEAKNDFVYEEVAIFAYLRVNDTVYQYTLLVSPEVHGPLLIYNIIATAFRYIETCDTNTILSDLEQISTSVSTYDQTTEYKMYYKDILWKYDSVFIHAGKR